jgi:hypothetical protein
MVQTPPKLSTICAAPGTVVPSGEVLPVEPPRESLFDSSAPMSGAACVDLLFIRRDAVLLVVLPRTR